MYKSLSQISPLRNFTDTRFQRNTPVTGAILVDSPEIALAARQPVPDGDDPSDSLSHATWVWTQRCRLPAEHHGHINIEIYEVRPRLLPGTSKQQSHLPVTSDLTGMICEHPGRDPEVFFCPPPPPQHWQELCKMEPRSWWFVQMWRKKKKKKKRPLPFTVALFAMAELDQLRDVNRELVSPKTATRPTVFSNALIASIHTESRRCRWKNPEPKEPTWPISSLQTAN